VYIGGVVNGSSEGNGNGNGKRGWAALGLTPGNFITVFIALGSAFASYVADRETIAVLKAENAYLKEQISNTSLRVTTLEMRNDAGEERLRTRIEELRDLLMQNGIAAPPSSSSGEIRRYRNGTRVQ
jgi:hypothetical protein